MSCDASSSWPRARRAPPLAAVATIAPRRAFFLFFARKPAVSCCADGTTPADFSSSSLASSRRSYGRPWYNPLRQSQLDSGPEISRLWIDADRTLGSSPERFTVASYNILSDKNAFKHTDLYTNVPYVYMKWGRRKRVICEELIGWNPDIICLQEVDK